MSVPEEGAERKEDRSDSKSKIKSIDLNAILITEIEKIVTGLEQSAGEVDHSLLKFLDGHVERYLNMLKIVRKVGEETPAYQTAKRLQERICKMLGRATEVVPPNEQTETIKRFIEAEDNELLAKHMDELKAENEKLRNLVEQEDSDILKNQIQTLEIEREALRQTVDALKLTKESMPTGTFEQQAMTEVPATEALAKIRGEVENRVKVEYELKLDDAKREAESYKQKVKIIANKFRDLQNENASLSAMINSMQTDRLRLTQEIAQWRQKVNQWQSSMDDVAERRARTMLESEKSRLNETLASLKAKEKLLKKIEGIYEIVADREGENCLVIPRSISQTLPKSPGNKIKMEIKGTSVNYTKT